MDEISALCQYKNHRIVGTSPGSLYSYQDDTHGIVKRIDICDDCLYEHVHRHYPGCAIERALLMQHPEWSPEPTQPELL